MGEECAECKQHVCLMKHSIKSLCFISPQCLFTAIMYNHYCGNFLSSCVIFSSSPHCIYLADKENNIP